MNYIENNDLDDVSSKIHHLQVGTYYLSVTLDAFASSYQKKITRSRKSLKKEGMVMMPSSEAPYLRSGQIADQPLSLSDDPLTPPTSETDSQEVGESRLRSYSVGVHSYKRRPQRRRTSSLGDLSEPSSKALFLDMITALNEAFPDYDFGDSKIVQFKDLDIGSCVQHVNSCLAEVTLLQPQLLDELWTAIDDMVSLRQCEVFAFLPADSDEEDAYLWRFHYFFFNKSVRRLLYFSCGAKSLLRKRNEDYSSEEEEEDMACEGGDASFDFAVNERGRMADSDSENDEMDDEDAESGTEMPDWDGII